MTTQKKTSSRRKLKPKEMEVTGNLRSIWDQKKKSMKLTQESAAVLLGWTQGAVGQYLNGKIPLNTDAIIKWAALLKVQVQDIDPKSTLIINLDEAHNYMSTLDGSPLPEKLQYELDKQAPVAFTATPQQELREDNTLYMALNTETNQLELLKSVIETIETILVEEDITLTPEEKASAIIACLQTCIKRGIDKATSPDIAATAIHAVS